MLESDLPIQNRTEQTRSIDLNPCDLVGRKDESGVDQGVSSIAMAAAAAAVAGPAVDGTMMSTPHSARVF